MLPLSLIAQDSVVVRGNNGGRDVTRTGQIIDWVGNELRMETSGRVITIETDRIASVDSNWTTEYLSAQQAIAERRLLDAIPSLQAAMGAETRAWARRMMAPQLVRLLNLAGYPQLAGETFLQLIDDDPQTRNFSVIPLAWENVSTDAGTVAAAQKWMASDLLPAQLLGASWLLASPYRAEALKKLETLSRDLDGRIAHLAAGQLWRDQMLTADGAQLARWERQIERMPSEIRSGPLLVLGEALQRNSRDDDAAIAWLRVTIVHADDYRQAGFALRQCASLFQNKGQADEAARLWSELIRDFPETPWAAEAAKALDQ